MDNLKLLRVAKSLTQIELAIKTGISQSKLSRMENGYYVAKPEELAKLKTVLGEPEEVVKSLLNK